LHLLFNIFKSVGWLAGCVNTSTMELVNKLRRLITNFLNYFQLRRLSGNSLKIMERQQLLDKLSNKSTGVDLPSPKARYPMLNDIYLKKTHTRDGDSRSPSPTGPSPQPQVNVHQPVPQPHRPKLADLVGGIHGIQTKGLGGNVSPVPSSGRVFGGNSEAEERISIIIRENDALLAQNARLATDLAHLESEKGHCKYYG
jgi:hypothetical protein